MPLPAILPVFGRSNGRLVVEYSDAQEASSTSARSARFSFSYGSSTPVFFSKSSPISKSGCMGLGRDGEAHLLADGAGEEAPDRMRQPTSGLPEFWQGGAAGP